MQDFLCRDFHKHKDYESMGPRSNQPGRLLTTTKAHNFESIEDISLENLKLRIDQTGTYIYNASNSIAKCLPPLSKNEDTFSFQELLKNTSNGESYEDVSSDVGSLFTSIPVQETVDYILQRIYVGKEIKAFCKKSMFKSCY